MSMEKQMAAEVEDTIAVIAGSHRRHSQSRKVANHVAQLLGNAWVLDLAEASIPMWEEDIRSPSVWLPFSERLKRSAGVVFVVPEWGGMVPAALKNLFLLCDSHELAHKAGLIVSVSTGSGGSYPVCELRMSSYKNTRICYVPDHVIVRNVGSVLNAQSVVESPEDQYVRDRIEYALGVFNVYVSALEIVRRHPAVDLETYFYGM